MILLSACSTQTPAIKAPQKPKTAQKPRAAKPEPAPKEPAPAAIATKPPPANRACDVEEPALPESAKLIWPVDGVVIAGFGKREGAPHDGIDIAAPIGTPIRASKSGEVLYSGERPGYGHMVILGHDGGMVTIYAHNAKNCVNQGTRVSQGSVIGLVGESGGATSPAVHFEIRLESKPVKPRPHLPD